MSAYSIWLDLEKESRVSYRKIISTLSKRLKSPLFEPHCTIYGRLDIKLIDLENLPEPDVIAEEISDNLESALESVTELIENLKKKLVQFKTGFVVSDI